MCTISLCMIVKNEEEILTQCLSSIKEVCDEIIIVDTGSTDQTKDIAKDFTDKIFDFEWIDDFAAARNFAFSHATKDYILWLDADDHLLKEDQLKFKLLKKNLNASIDAVSMIYNIAFDEYGNPTFSYRRNRLVRREKKFKWIGPVHEYLEVSGNIYPSEIAITHRKSDKTNVVQSDRNLIIYEKRLKNGEDFSPRDLYYYANELKDHAYFQKAIKYYRKFLATKKGWVEDEIRSYINMADCYRNLGKLIKEKKALVMSFIHDVPRPEVSCRLGDLYKANKEFNKAIVWYRLALEKESNNNQGFKQEAYSTWYPHLQLCVCYWEAGEKKLAVEHNNCAKVYRPNDSSVKTNEKFFETHFKSRDM